MNLIDFILSKKEEYQSKMSDPLKDNSNYSSNSNEQYTNHQIENEEKDKSFDSENVNANRDDIKKIERLREENSKLSKRPTIEAYEKSEKQVQQLAMKLKNIKETTVSRIQYEKLEGELKHSNQMVQSTILKNDQLNNQVIEYKVIKEKLENQLEQVNSKVKNMIDKDSYQDLERRYESLNTSYEIMNAQYQRQAQHNKLYQVGIQQLEEHIKQFKASIMDDPQVGEIATTLEVAKEKDNQLGEIEEDLIEIIKIEDITLNLNEMDFEFSDIEDKNISNHDNLLLEQEVNESKMVETMSEVLLSTLPSREIDFTLPYYDHTSFFPRDDENERNYLRLVLMKINESKLDTRKVDFNDTYEIDYATAYVEGIRRKREYNHNRQLETIKDKPYIGRVDYVSDSGPETIYIGEQGIDGYVVSWKTEAASLYYMRTVGHTFQHKSLGEVLVDYIRQIDIQAGKIMRLHSPITADSQFSKDEGLVSALESKRGLDMKSIVATLQREQYEIIQLPMSKPIIIQGSAGSGKSAIALHRLSYLLYKYKNLEPEKVAILGPNEAFLKHIQNVLPTLGDFGIKQTTFIGMASDLLMITPSKLKYHSKNELDLKKWKGTIFFQEIVEETTRSIMNDLRIWAKPYLLRSLSIPIVPILREMEKYQHLTLKDRDNLYLNFFVRSYQQELDKEKKLQSHFKKLVKEKGKWMEAQVASNLTLTRNEFITPKITELVRECSSIRELYLLQPSKEGKQDMNFSQQKLVKSIKSQLLLHLKEKRVIIEKYIPDIQDDAMIMMVWQNYLQTTLRKERELVILKHLTEQDVEIFSIDSMMTESLNKELEQLQEKLQQELAREKQTFFGQQKEKMQQAILEESLMLLEKSYYKQVSTALDELYKLDYNFINKFKGYLSTEIEDQIPIEDLNSLKNYIKKHLKLDIFDCYDEAIRVSKSKGYISNVHQSMETYMEDLPALLHINRLLYGVRKEHLFSYLIVDEAQDYMPYELVELNALTKTNGLMLIGDVGQNLNPASSFQSWNELERLLGSTAYYELKGTYRSTSQIINVSNNLIEPFAKERYTLSMETFRRGSEVEWVEIVALMEEQELVRILEEVLFTHNYDSVAVIVKEEEQIGKYHYMLDPYFSVAVQTSDVLPTDVKIIITTPTAVKGLEFEAVVMVNFNEYSNADFDRKLAYVASSRALHQLYITFEQGKKCILNPKEMKNLIR